MRLSIIGLMFSFLCVNISIAQINKFTLNNNWEFKKVGTNEWLKAKVPGTVQEDLLRLNQIPHPHIGTNEDSIQWIENEDWIYKLNFELDDSILIKTNHNLIFYGVDTYADIYLNDELILSVDNMFRTWEINVSEKLETQNTLQIYFHSPIKKGKYILENLPWELPAGNDVGKIKVSPVVRKAAYHFGWDWGPRIVTCGIWKPIILESYNENKIEEVEINYEIEKNRATVTTSINLNNKPNDLKANIYLNNKEIASTPLHEKNNQVVFEIKNPKLWWPNGYGNAYLYDFRIELEHDNKIIDQWSKKIGLRTVELINQIDSIGTSYYFKINGEDVFAKGANYIPQSHFINAITDQDYTKLLSAAHDANMNMLRVWGGGIYEQDIFYALCDSLGIMVWQDLMFANTMYPDDDLFLSNIENEIVDNVRRIRHHPSIVHWCGNNEINVAWFNWGWQSQYNYSKEDSVRLYNNYEKIFKQVIPKLVDSLSPSTPYTHTSPLSNWGTKENFNHGSMHYWGVYHGNDNFDDYAKNVGRFNSEYGFQSFPTWNSLKNIFEENDKSIDSPILIHRQKSYKKNKPIYDQIENYFPKPKTLKELSYLSQLTQAIGIQKAINAHRSSQPHCMGTLYWQLNDVWPAISWSSIDATGEWKALHYTVKKAYQQQSILMSIDSNKYNLMVVSDHEIKDTVSVSVVIEDLNGKEIFAKSKSVSSLLKGVNKVKFNEIARIIERFNNSNLVIKSTMDINGVQSEKLTYLVKPKELRLSKPKIKFDFIQVSNGIKITLNANCFVKNLWLQNDVDGHFENNYFDMLANHDYEVVFKTDHKLEDFKNSFEFVSLNDILLRE